jgi:CRP/FNR family transcriptional regulator
MGYAVPESIRTRAGRQPPPVATACANCTARDISVCGAAPAGDSGRVWATASHRRADAGETLLSQGDKAMNFLNIVDGTVKVYKLLPDGRRQITGFLYPGDLLGLAVNDTYTSSAEALTPVRYCQFPRRQFERLVDEFRAMEKRLLARASNELVAAQEQMVMLGRKTAQEKLASFLMTSLERARRFNRRGDVIVLPMTRADIADYLGLTTETVSRGFTRLKTQGSIELLAGGKIRICEFEQLTELAAGNAV